MVYKNNCNCSYRSISNSSMPQRLKHVLTASVLLHSMTSKTKVYCPTAYVGEDNRPLSFLDSVYSHRNKDKPFPTTRRSQYYRSFRVDLAALWLIPRSATKLQICPVTWGRRFWFRDKAANFAPRRGSSVSLVSLASAFGR